MRAYVHYLNQCTLPYQKFQNFLTSILLSVIATLSMAMLVAASEAGYGTRQYGYDLDNWAIICSGVPYLAGSLVPSDVLNAIQLEGWGTPGEMIRANAINDVCLQLGFLPPA